MRILRLHLKTSKNGSDITRGRAVHFNHRKTIDCNDSSDAEENLMFIYTLMNGPQIQL